MRIIFLCVLGGVPTAIIYIVGLRASSQVAGDTRKFPIKASPTQGSPHCSQRSQLEYSSYIMTSFTYLFSLIALLSFASAAPVVEWQRVESREASTILRGLGGLGGSTDGSTSGLLSPLGLGGILSGSTDGSTSGLLSPLGLGGILSSSTDGSTSGILGPLGLGGILGGSTGGSPADVVAPFAEST
ncbi:hypothetical protein BU17DRAFT_86035 [Hysterangium stoloniferum]|nr:hypothetical protein BU17DRAFT_86035 [Hysterangium stoloniferum]